ncbi:MULTISPECIES: hypothetical protein [unclassified Aeromicrobium]|uniref:hypothetical protein n=1 Tax=unclassified Aeromicrobium TaxID=2633570 RepID=UPI00396AF755
MNRPILRWLSAAALSGVAATALVAPATPAAAATEAFCSDGSQPMVTQDEVTTFAEGEPVTGLTVVKGTQPVEFTGEYVGHLENALGQGVDMLLFELSGAGIDTGNPRAGIWSGMSGSPVYTQDGRLIGAVAYGLNFDNIPIAGVTPADYMKKSGVDRLGPARVSVTRSSLSGASAATEKRLAGTSLPLLKTRKVVAGGAKANALANRTLKRVPGGSATARAARAGGFASVAAPTRMAEPLVPGGNIAVGYSTGDLFSGGVGTVTAICGSTVWAFGHPMDFAGETSLSIHNASTALVVPDATGLVGSYKQVSRIGQQIGTITHDGYGAIRGQLGVIEGFPVTTYVYDAKGKRIATYAGTAVNRDMAPFAAAYAPSYAALDLLDNYGIGTARHVWRINYKLRGGRTGSLANVQVYADREMLADELAGHLGNDVASLLGTDLADVTITSITSHLTLRSAKAIDYRYAGAERWNGRAWVKLHGSSVRRGTGITVRPVYRQYVNGRPQGTLTGPGRKFAIGKNAAGRVKVAFAARAQPSLEDCEIDEDGEIWCPGFGDDEDGPRRFSELIAQLDALIPADQGRVTASWNWKVRKAKGSSQRTASFFAPGVVGGTYTATLKVRR